MSLLTCFRVIVGCLVTGSVDVVESTGDFGVCSVVFFFLFCVCDCVVCFADSSVESPIFVDVSWLHNGKYDVGASLASLVTEKKEPMDHGKSDPVTLSRSK